MLKPCRASCCLFFYFYIMWLLLGDALRSIWRCGGSLSEAAGKEVAARSHDYLSTRVSDPRQQLYVVVPAIIPSASAALSPMSTAGARVTGRDIEKDTAVCAAHGLSQAADRREELPLASNRDSIEPHSNFVREYLRRAEFHHEAGEQRHAVEALDRFLGIEGLTQEVTSFVLNRKGIYLLAAGDVSGAQESYELALRGGQDNRHALTNLASLLHHHIFPQRPTELWILSRAIEMYRTALGRDDASLLSSPSALPLQHSEGNCRKLPQTHTLGLAAGVQKLGEGVEDDKEELASSDCGIGGPIEKSTVSIELATALSQAGHADKAVAELELTLAQISGFTTAVQQEVDSGQAHADMRAAVGSNARDAAALWDRLASARFNTGDFRGAVAAAKTAVELLENEPVLYHNLGTILQMVGLVAEAEEAWRKAIAIEPGMVVSLSSLGHLEGARGNIKGAREHYESALAILTARDQNNDIPDRVSPYARSKDDILIAKFHVATAVVPLLYDSPSHILQVRQDFERGLDRLLKENENALPMMLESPVKTVGSGSLGYYIIYQGFEDLEIRRKLAKVYWRLAPSLRYCAPFLEDNEKETSTFYRRNDQPVAASPAPGLRSPTPLAGPPNPRSITADRDPARVEVQLPLPHDADILLSELHQSSPPLFALPEESKVTPESDLSASGSTDALGTGAIDEEAGSPCRQRRLRVGFLSAFFFHHSVGLLMEGVMTRLDRHRFETTVIFLQPHPNSGGDGGKDRVYEVVRREAEHVLDIPSSSLAACHHAIGLLELDVLVFTEIGMNAVSYFLSFARLARRSALFWGHAVTSGVSAFDAVSTLPLSARVGVVGRPPDSSVNDRSVGGVDYFVSSWLFEDNELKRSAQCKYSERLYLMKGLTTRFARPPPPEPGVVTRDSLGIPPRPDPTRFPGEVPDNPPLSASSPPALRNDGGGNAVAFNGTRTCGALYLVPQTLYKIHPDFDRLVAGVLRKDLLGCVVFIQAFEAEVTQGLAIRMSATLRAEGVVEPERTIFIRRLGFHEFSGLIALADVVLDPFPVGGGRSSFEVFAVGTPIVMLYNRTSVLQLTYGMYVTMGLKEPIVDADSSNPPVVRIDGALLPIMYEDRIPDPQLNLRIREQILANNHRLYGQDSVVAEWEAFLEGIAFAPRPHPAKRNNFAVDAGNFSRPLAWCSSDVGGNGNDGQDDGEAVHGGGRSDFDDAGGNSLSRANQEGSEDGSELGLTLTDSNVGRPVEDHLAKDETRTFAHQQPQSGSVPPRGRRLESEEPTSGSTRSGWSANVMKSGSRYLQTDDSENGNEAEDRSRKLLYAVRFSVAPEHDGEPTRKLLAEIFQGDDPVEEARKMMEVGGLEFLQYRWVEHLLRRAVGRLTRPIVWSKHIQIDDGPSLLLEVRQGDDLYQVAHWHCHKHSLGFERAGALSEQLEREIPQHEGSKWIASRAADRVLSSSMHRNRPQLTRNGLPRTDLSSRLAATLRGTDCQTGVDACGMPRRDGGDIEARNKRGAAVKGSYDGCVTLAITTCKRLHEFLGTVAGLKGLLGPLQDDGKRLSGDDGERGGPTVLPRVCDVIVVDDGSSVEDRRVMMSSHPEFTYVFKAEGDETGHAGSMNIIMSLTQTRYLLYIEDDWWPVKDEPSQDQPWESSFLWRSMEVLRNSIDGVSQVLINDQSSRSCALGDVAKCPPGLQGRSGWPRSTPSAYPCRDSSGIDIPSRDSFPPGFTNSSQEERTSEVHQSDSCEWRDRAQSAETRMGTADRHDGVGQGGVEYRLHEFGLMYPSHHFSYWPGFSFNPALWDLQRLNDAYRISTNHIGGLWFDPTDIRFEQTISMELFDAGVTIAFLPDITFKHVGHRRSAYEAKGIHRPWDGSSS